jgi:uncharacterized protein
MADRLRVQVCYALPGAASLLTIEIDEGATLQQVILASGVLARHPEIDLSTSKIGVFGKLRLLSDPARAGDRIEIYRPLIADPKDSRRRRAKHKSRAAGKA